MLSGKWLVTGGSGYLGRAILKKAHEEDWDAEFTVYSRDETKQWELKHRFPDVRCILGAVEADLPRMIAAFTGMDGIVHAGAVKYIPEAEHNVAETLAVNVDGSRNVGVAAIAAGVKTVIGISTDKACAPLNVYGMTKALMERLYSEFNKRSKYTNFLTVRYGNVIGSTGSVIPLFKRQMAEHGEIHITDKRMTRFWLTPYQAVSLVEYAAEEASRFAGMTIIDPCPAMSIDNLAQAVWEMNNPGYPAKIIEMGKRPGEKLHESLYSDIESGRILVRDYNLPYFVMVPVTEPLTASIDGAVGYSSESPRSWISIEDMINNIEQAALI